MILLSHQLRSETKSAFPCLKSLFSEYVECLDETYLVPPHDETLALIEKYWEPIKNVPWTRNIGDCDNRAIKLYVDVHWHRNLHKEEYPEEERIQWSFGFASGIAPFGGVHTWNLVRTDKGLFVFDNVVKNTENYTPITVRW